MAPIHCHSTAARTTPSTQIHTLLPLIAFDMDSQGAYSE